MQIDPAFIFCKISKVYKLHISIKKRFSSIAN